MQLCENGLATARMVGGLSPCLQGDMHACGSIHDLWGAAGSGGQRATADLESHILLVVRKQKNAILVVRRVKQFKF